MEPIPKSGLYYPNKAVRIALLAFEEVMGKNGLNAILNLANQTHLIDNYPPDNLERQFDFSDFSMINAAAFKIAPGFTNRGENFLADQRPAFNGGRKGRSPALPYSPLSGLLGAKDG